MYDRHSGRNENRGGERNDRGGNDRGGEDDYYSRYNHGKRYGGYKEGNYRRNDDYYSYRGNPRRRPPNLYDLYHGSKYRPKNYDNWRKDFDYRRERGGNDREGNDRERDRGGNDRNDRSEREKIANERELLDERRLTSRKFDREKNRPYARPSHRDQYKPDRESLEGRSSDHHGDFSEQAPEKSGEISLELRDLDGKSQFSENTQSEKKELFGKNEPFEKTELQKVHAESEKDEIVKFGSESYEVKPEKEDGSFPEEQSGKSSEKSEPEKLELHEMKSESKDEISNSESGDTYAKDKGSHDKDSNDNSNANDFYDKSNDKESDENDDFNNDNDSNESDTSNVADTSVLSPIGNTTTDDFIRNMDDDKMDVESEAETVVNESFSLENSKRFLRKNYPDPERRRIKRNIVISDNEASDDDEPDHEKVGLENEDSDNDDNEGEESDNQEPNERLDFEVKVEKKEKPAKTYKIKRDSTGRSQLQRACKKGNLAEARELIKNGANPNESDFGGFTCLHEAALAGHTQIVKLLIANGADVNKQALDVGDLETPLMDAAENKHVDTVSALLENGADANICNIDGYSTLTKILQLKEEDDEYEEIIELLTDFSPALPRKVIEDPSEGYFSDLAKKKSNPLIFKYAAQGLKEAAAEDFITNAYSLLKMPDILNLAARNGHVELVDILLGLNPGSFDINAKNKIGVNALLASAGRGVYDVTKFLLSKGADPKITRDVDGLCALEIAKHSAQYDPREVLLLQGDEKEKEQENEKERKERKRTLSTSKESPPKRRAEDMETAENSEFIKSQRAAKSEEPEKSEKSERPESGKPESATDAETKEKSVEKVEKVVEKVEKIEKPAEKVKSPEELAQAAALLKAQEEQKIKAAEQAKMWQEKVQAKKKARKEMFLQAEKEKERKRKEDEERRIELLKQQEVEQQRQKEKAVEEAKMAAAERERKKRALEIECIVNEYPIGLRGVVFGEEVSENNLLRYSPLYVFEKNGRKCVVDLQLSLLLSQAVTELPESVGEISDDEKQKLWVLFFEMVGVKNGTVEKSGPEKFQRLLLHFLDLDSVAAHVKKLHVYDKMWKNVVQVDMATLCAGAPEMQAPKPSLRGPGFVPPRLRRRGDIMRTVQAANTPLW